MSVDYSEYFSGRRLIGDDYSAAEIEAWFADEREAYAQLGDKDRATYRYEYGALNWFHGFRHLDPKQSFQQVCAFGSAWGDELVPIAGRATSIVLVDSSQSFSGAQIGGTPTRFVNATQEGRIGLPDGSIDLITCFGVLHHIPNVSFVVKEMGRCLRPGGWLLVREPTTSMGDWRQRRRGVTPRERGIPAPLFRPILEAAGFDVLHGADCVFPPWNRMLDLLGVSVYESAVLTRIDHLLCRLTSWNYSYHRTGALAKFAPASQFFVCRRRAT